MSREAAAGIGNTLDQTVDTGITLTTKFNDFRNATYTLHSNTTITRPVYLPAGGLWLDNNSAAAWKLNIFDGTDNITLLTINTSSNVVTLPDASTPFVIISGTVPGTLDPTPAGFRDIAVRSETTAGLSLLGADASIHGINLGSDADTTGAQFTWQRSTVAAKLGTTYATGTLSLMSGDGVTAVTLDGSQRVGIGITSPNTNSKLHVVKGGSSTATASTTADDFIFEGNASIGMSLLCPAANISTLIIGSKDAETGLTLSWDKDTISKASIGTNFAGSDLNITYKAGATGIHLDSADDYIGIFNSAPEGPFHHGAALPSNWDGLAGDGSYFFHSATDETCKLNLISPNQAVGLQLINRSLSINYQMISLSYKNSGDFAITSKKDKAGSYAVHKTMLSWDADTGDLTLPDLAGSGNRYVYVDSAGKLIAGVSYP